MSWTDPEFWTSTTGIEIAVGIVVACGALVLLRRVRRKSTISVRQARVVGQFQAVPPLTAAIERLGNRDAISERVAAIETLMEEAKGSARSYWTAADALTGYLKRNARAAIGPAAATAPDKKDLPPDIQAILFFLLHRNPRYEDSTVSLDLRGIDLSHADLRGIYLRYADLRGAVLHGAALDGANFRRANLGHTRFTKANLRGADLRDVDFSEANLRDADLRETDLRGAVLNNMVDLIGADLSKADLRGTVLTDVVLCEAKLSGASMRGAMMDFADLRGAALDGAVLCDVNFTGADLRDANLKGADLSGARLTGANLRGADLQDADLTGAEYRPGDLEGAKNIAAPPDPS